MARLAGLPDRTTQLINNPINLAVVGVGAFGQNHARIYRQLQQDGAPLRLAALIDINLERARGMAAEFEAEAFPSIEAMLASGMAIQAASVAVPTIAHFKTARTLMESGIDVLVEKPVASTVAEADELIRVAEVNSCIAQVGHVERFNPAVRATFPLITRPMFFEVHRLSVFTPRSLDVDVVLDLMIHDLDIVLAFVRSPVREIRAVGLPILSGKVDIANVRVQFESGCVANFTASRVSTERVRKLRFFQAQQYISIDYGRQDVLVFSIGSQSGAAPSANPEIGISKPAVPSEEPLRAELKSFIEAVQNRSSPLVSLQDGRRALALALDIAAAIHQHGEKIKLDTLKTAQPSR
jgi:predicted dehydrogenase